MKKLLLIGVPAVLLFAFLAAQRSAPLETPFTKVTREPIVSNLNTNGRAEPIEWSAIRADRAGAVEAVLVERGQPVKKGQLLVRLDPGAARADLAGAQARVSAAGAERQVVEQGGRAADIAAAESGLNSARQELASARRELASLERLQKSGAATQAEVNAARDTARRAESQIQTFEKQRSTLVGQPDRTNAEARLREAQSEAQAARVRIEQSRIRSPQDGVLYQLEVRNGAYLNPGDIVGAVGRLNRMRVVVFVDEPELGRVEKGMSVTITWDAIPGREWKGEVEKKPTQVITLGTRQVGEVFVAVDNPDLTLLPGINVNAEIRSRVEQNALAIPKEAIRRQGAETGVFKLVGQQIQWTPVRLGISSVTRAQILAGLVEGDAIALPVDRPLKDGDKVEAVYR